jgi:hypothetical protein
MPICSKCKLEKDLKEFGKRLGKRRYACKQCERDYTNNRNWTTGKFKKRTNKPKHNIVGNKINSLTIIDNSEVINGTRFCLCRCDCGKIIKTREAALLTKKTKSCGCLQHLKGEKNKRWKGHMGIGMTYWNQVKNSAKNRKIDFDITIEEAWNLFINQNKKCAISGVDIELCQSYIDYTSGKMTASIDRIDSSIGYKKDNIQWVHKDVNKIKTDFNQEKFITWCCLIAENHNRKLT